ncbi:MAG: diguanylate cyclase with and sensor, partial [Actinomycetia bacterium]|nr:diguanylate cyclase with and sensor [Actinomycetes bacterium]
MDAASELELLRAILETQRLVDECQGDIDAVMDVVVERSLALTGADQAVVELVEGPKPIGWSAVGASPAIVASRMEVVMRLPVSGEHVGTLAVRSASEGAFDDHDLELLDALGDLVANVVHHARVVAERDERARRDDLTGLANRRHLLDRLAVALARATHTDDAVTVLFLDLDGFKPVNDTLGHRAGDQVLRAVGRAVAATVRPTDTVA